MVAEGRNVPEDVLPIEGLTVIVPEEDKEGDLELLTDPLSVFDTAAEGDTVVVRDSRADADKEFIGRAVRVNIICVDVAHILTVLDLDEDIVILGVNDTVRDRRGEIVTDTEGLCDLEPLVLGDPEMDVVLVLDWNEDRLSVLHALDDRVNKGLLDPEIDPVDVFDTLMLRVPEAVRVVDLV